MGVCVWVCGCVRVLSLRACTCDLQCVHVCLLTCVLAVSSLCPGTRTRWSRPCPWRVLWTRSGMPYPPCLIPSDGCSWRGASPSVWASSSSLVSGLPYTLLLLFPSQRHAGPFALVLHLCHADTPRVSLMCRSHHVAVLLCSVRALAKSCVVDQILWTCSVVCLCVGCGVGVGVGVGCAWIVVFGD
jgi:hypothetical protein